MESGSHAIVITLSKIHIQYCQALIGSLKYYQVQLPIIILKDGSFKTNTLNQTENVTILESAEVNKCHNYNLFGLLNKINIIFLERLGLKFDFYIHMDADSIITSPSFVSNLICKEEQFCILQGKYLDYTDKQQERIFDNFAFSPDDFKTKNFSLSTLFYFSSGHFKIHRSLFNYFELFLKTYRAELKKNFSKDTRFKFGDQGFFNFVINQLAQQNKIDVCLMDSGIYGRSLPTEFPKLNLYNVVNKQETGVGFVHYTGPSRKIGIKSHHFGDILYFFLNYFFRKQPWLFHLSKSYTYATAYYNRYLKKIKLKLKFN